MAQKEIELRDRRKKSAGMFSDFVKGKAGFDEKRIDPLYFFETIRDVQRKNENNSKLEAFEDEELPQIISIQETENEFHNFDLEDAVKEVRKHNEISKSYSKNINGYTPNNIDQKELDNLVSEL